MSLNLRKTYETGNSKKHLQACDVTGSIYGKISTSGRKKFVFGDNSSERQAPSKRYGSLYKQQSSILNKLLSRSK